jgi:uncharacterized delta-60 repeat protein
MNRFLDSLAALALSKPTLIHLCRIVAFTAITGLLALMPVSRHASALDVTPQAPGDLDSTFGIGGKVTSSFSGFGDQANAIAIQADGKIIAAGSTRTNNTDGNTDFALARYNVDGTLDTTFGLGGKVTTEFSTSVDVEEARGIALQSDGKIVVAGHRATGQGDSFALARYNPDGTLDTSFGAGGLVSTTFLGFDQAFAVGIQTDGKIVAAGSASDGTSSGTVVALARYHTDGTLDLTFGAGGRVTVRLEEAIAPGFQEAHSLAFQQDGKIVIAALHEINGVATNGFLVARFNTDGTLDSSFGMLGFVGAKFLAGTEVADARAITVQPDGRILVAGTSGDGGPTSNFAVARFATDGNLDPTFGTAGKVITSFFQGADRAFAIALQSTGKIVVAGTANGVAFGLVRYNPDGSLDNSFGSGAKVTTLFSSGSESANAVAFQSDGKIVAVGSASPAGPTFSQFAVGRYDSGLAVESFTVAASPQSLTIQPGNSATFIVTVQSSSSPALASISPQALTVNLTASVAPQTSAISTTILPNQVNTGSVASLSVSVSSQATPGNYTVTVTGTSGQIVQSAQATVVVPAAPTPDFSLSLAQAVVTADRGTKVGIGVTITRTGGFTGSVTITPPAPGDGIKPKPPDPMTTTDSGVTFKLKVGAGATPSQHQLTFTGTDASGRTRTTILTLNVQ